MSFSGPNSLSRAGLAVLAAQLFLFSIDTIQISPSSRKSFFRFSTEKMRVNRRSAVQDGGQHSYQPGAPQLGITSLSS